MLLALSGGGAASQQAGVPEQEAIPGRVVIGLPDPTLARGLLTQGAGGDPDGFARQLVELAAQRAGLACEFRRVHDSNGERELLAGDIDVLCPLSVNQDRVALFAFTAPILMVNGAVFVHPGTPAPLSLEELGRRRIAVAGAGIAHQFCVEKGLSFEVEPSLYLALESVVEGRVDCAISTQVAGRVELERLAMQPLEDHALDQDRLRQAFALALRPTSKKLEARLNYGLALVRDSGAWEELYDRWVAPYQPRPRPRSYARLVIGILVLLVGAGVVVLSVLRRRLTNSARALDASERRYRVVAESLPALVFSSFVGPDGRRERRFATSNLEAWRTRFPNLDPEDEAALTADVHAEDRARYEQEWWRARAATARLEVEFRLRATNGHYHWLHSTATPVKVDGGVLWQSLVLDTTQLREAQNERHRLELKLAQAQKLEGLGLLVGSIAHDFNNLLMEIQGNVELGLEASDARERRERLRAALAGTERAADRTRQLLASAGEVDVVETVVDLAAIVREAVQDFSACHGHRLSLGLELQESGPFVRGDAELLRLAFRHLLENAIESIPLERTGRVKVRARVRSFTELELEFLSSPLAPGRQAELVVEDDGLGMDADTARRVFDPFFSTKFVGRGLGLTIVQRTVERHGGSVHVNSSSGNGTILIVLLPLAQPRVHHEKPALPAPFDAPARRVLVVDDEESVLDITCSLLQSRGWSAARARDAEEAFASIREVRPTVVLLDFSMPGMDGARLLRCLRQDFPGLPLVLMSGYSESRLAEEAEADGFLSKPFSSTQLVETIERTLAAKRAPI